MIGLGGTRVDPDPRLRAEGQYGYQVPYNDFFGAVFDDAFASNPTQLLWRAGSRLFDDAPTLSAEEANARFGVEGHLRFDQPVTEAYAQDLRRLKQAELEAQAIRTRSGRGAFDPLALTAGFAASFLDPINVAASFIPVVGQARYGAMLAGAGGAIGRAGVRLGVGAAEGAAGAALLEPLVYGLSRAEQRDYSAADSFFNIAFGTVLGGGLHVGAGAVRDLAFGPPGGLHPMVQAQAIDQAAAQVAADEPIQPVPGTSLDEAFQATQRQIAEAQARADAVAADRAARAEASLEPIATRPIGETTQAFLPTGEPIDTQLALVELGDLVTSHSDDFTVDPRFPEALQPRDRSRPELQAQVIGMAASLEPRMLGPEASLDRGAPLIAADGTVESGNGRTMAIRRAYRLDGAPAYRAWLEAQGYDVAGMTAPVLVRVRRTPLDLEGRARLGKDANRTAIAAHDATEQGRADAAVLAGEPDALRATRGRSLDAADQAQAATALLRTIASDAEMTGLTEGGRTINAAGRARLAAAVRGYAWAPLIRALTGDAGELQGLADALGDAALPWARLRAAAGQGIVPAELDITEGLVKAVDVIRRARSEGQKVGDLVAQLDLFEAPLVTAALRILFQDAGFSRVRAKGQIADLLDAYAEEAARFRAGEADLFGPPPTPDQILDAVRGKRSAADAPAETPSEAPSAAANVARPAPDVSSPQAYADLVDVAETAPKVDKPDAEIAALKEDAEAIEAEIAERQAGDEGQGAIFGMARDLPPEEEPPVPADAKANIDLGKQAIERIMGPEQAEGVRYAMRRNDIEGGWISFLYGKDGPGGWGLAHIVEGRTEKDGIDGEAFVRRLPEAIAMGRPGSYYLEKGRLKRAIIANTQQGPITVILTFDHRQGVGTWVLTAFGGRKPLPISGTQVSPDQARKMIADASKPGRKVRLEATQEGPSTTVPSSKEGGARQSASRSDLGAATAEGIAEEPAGVNRGAAAIIERLKAEIANDGPADWGSVGSGGVDADQVAAVARLIEDVGPALVGDVGLAIADGRAGWRGQYEYGRELITLFRDAIARGEGGATLIHELWHSLARHLPDDWRGRVTEEWARAVDDYQAANPWYIAFRGERQISGARAAAALAQWPELRQRRDVRIDVDEAGSPRLTLRSTRENYRLLNADEWWAEVMTDRTITGQQLKDAASRSVLAHLRLVLDALWQGLRRVLGVSEATADLYADFMARRIEARPDGGSIGSPSAFYAERDPLISADELEAQQSQGRITAEEREAALARRTAAFNERARLNRRDFYNRFRGREGWALRTLIAGSERGGAGIARSVDAEAKGLANRLIGPLLSELRRQGLLDLMKPLGLFQRERHPQLETDVANELWRLTDEGGGRDTRNAQAKAIARALHTAQEAGRIMQNRAGAWINALPGYVVRQSHDLLKVRDAGFAAWRAAIEPRLTDETFATDEGPMTAADRTRFLEAVWRGVATGQHLKAGGAEDPLLRSLGSGSLAKRASQHRVLHFRSADDWLAYHREFGRGGVLDAALGGLERAAHNTALMRTWGTSPRAAFDADVEWLKARAPVAEVGRVGGWYTQALFEQVDGTARIPDSIGLAKVGQVTRAWISLTKLGGVVLSALPDIVVRAASLRHAGLSPMGQMAQGFGDLMARLPDDSTRREVADLIGAGIDGTVGAIAARFRAEDGLPGVMSRTLDSFFRLNLMSWWTDAQKTGIGLALSHHLAGKLGIGWQHLDAFTREGLSRYGISAEAWTLISGQASALRRAEDGRLYLTPEIVRGIPEADMIAYARPRSKNAQARIRAGQDARDALESSLATYFADQIRSAITDPTARTRATLQGNLRPGTAWGEAARFITQLKAYPTTYIQRHLGRELVRRGRPDVAGIALLVAGTTILGYASQTAKEWSRGRSARPVDDVGTWTAAFVQGGGLGIYGDFLFGQYNRFGGSLAGTLAGPWLGTADSLAKLLASARDGEDLGANAVRFGINAVPLTNLFYARMALDYLVLYQLQEWASPGYLRRLERRMKRDNNQTFAFPPSRAIPRGGGNRLLEGVR